MLNVDDKKGSENKWDLEAQHKVVCGNELQNIKSHNSFSSAWFSFLFCVKWSKKAEKEMLCLIHVYAVYASITTKNNHENCFQNYT